MRREKNYRKLKENEKHRSLGVLAIRAMPFTVTEGWSPRASAKMEGVLILGSNSDSPTCAT